MLPGKLVSVYEQYRRDTDDVASWLASTARVCGFPADLLSAGSRDGAEPAGGSRRLKGKARKEAKTKGKAKAGTGPAAAKQKKHIVAIADFTPLAQFITGSTHRLSPVSVPGVFGTTIDRVITARSGFASRLSEHGAEPDPKSDGRHNYFVGVLEEVRSAFRPLMRTQEKATAPSPSHGGDTATAAAEDHQGNRFASLEVSEPPQAFLDAPDAARPRPAAGDDTVYESEVPTSFEDALFAFMTVAEDLNRIRSVIKCMWADHREGKLEHAACAVATNTATDLARGLIDTALPQFAHYGGAWGVCYNFWVLTCSEEGFSLEQNYGQSGDSFLDFSDQGQLPVIREGIFGIYDPRSDRAAKNGTELRQFSALDDDTTRHFEFHEKLKIGNWSPENDHLLRNMQGGIQAMMKDPVYHLKVEALRIAGMAPEASMQPHRILLYS